MVDKNKLILWDKFNAEADIPTLLRQHGWVEKATRGTRIDFARPGKRRDGISANWDTSLKTFYVFTTNTSFESDRGYNAVQVFSHLECHGDMSEAAEKIAAMGYTAYKEPQIIGRVKLR